MIKTCRQCRKAYKPTPRQIKKYDYLCIPCKAADQRRYRLKRRKAGRPVKGGKASSAWWTKYYAAYYSNPVNKERRAANARKYRNDPKLRMRHEARWQAGRALKSGKIKREPCSNCGASKAQMHHRDYYKPLEVVWLCLLCHRAEHAKSDR